MWRRTGTSALTVLVLVAAAGCGSSGSDASGTTSTSAKAAESVTTTTTPTRAVDYGAQYLTLVNPSNCAIDRYNTAAAAVPETATFSDPAITSLQTAARDAAAITIEFYEALASAEWPADIQDEIDVVISEAASHARWLQQVGEATHDDSLVDALQTAFPSTAGASLVRAKLGIESNIGADRSDC